LKLQTKYKFSEQTRKRMSKAHKGKRHSKATIAKIRVAKQERDLLVAQGLLPKFHHSPATKKRLRLMALKRSHKLSAKDRKKALAVRRNRAADTRDEARVRKITR
jgi:hypothetical protein